MSVLSVRPWALIAVTGLILLMATVLGEISAKGASASGAAGAAGASGGSGTGGASGGGSGGASGGGSGGGSGAGVFGTGRATAPGEPDGGSLASLEGEVTAISEQAVAEIDKCILRDRRNAQKCMADELTHYAAALARLNVRMPKPLRALPAIIERAAKQIRVAPSVPKAVQIIKTAIAAVAAKATIELVKAEDPDAASIRDSVAGNVTKVLQHVSEALVRSIGI